MKPLAIAEQARKRGLSVLGICDHNSARNVVAVRRACELQGITVIGGIEVCSEEEVHVLGLFDHEEELQELQRLIDEHLQGENNPEFFGEQSVCDENDTIIGQEHRLLIGATTFRLEEVVENIRRLDGLVIASHVDRERFSIFSQLGFVPEGLQIDAMEVSPLHSVAKATDSFPQIGSYPLVRFSDAHRLEEIGKASTAFTLASPCVKEMRKAFLHEDGREIGD